MELFLIPVSLLFGLIFGSFFNVLIYRLNEENVPKFWQGRSICPKCKHQLAWFDNLPLFSFLSLKGKCRYCHKKISWQYPIVELTTAIATAVVVSNVFHSSSLVLLDLLVLIALLDTTYSLIVIFFSDLKYYLIPDEMVITFLLGAIGLCLLNPAIHPLLPNILVGLVGGFALLLIVIATKGRGLGMGDVKFAVPMGIFLGFPQILVAFWLAFVSGGIISLILVGLKIKSLKETIPLGPFLVLGTVCAFLWSKQLMSLIGL